MLMIMSRIAANFIVKQLGKPVDRMLSQTGIRPHTPETNEDAIFVQRMDLLAGSGGITIAGTSRHGSFRGASGHPTDGTQLMNSIRSRLSFVLLSSLLRSKNRLRDHVVSSLGAGALGNASADKGKLQINGASILAIVFSASPNPQGVTALATQLLNHGTLHAVVARIAQCLLPAQRYQFVTISVSV
jgi:hypothetical protein